MTFTATSVFAAESGSLSVGTEVVRPSATTTTPSVAANVKAIDTLDPSPPPGQAPWSGQSPSTSSDVEMVEPIEADESGEEEQ